MNCMNDDIDTDVIRYHVKKSENAKSVFAEAFHPFVQKYSNDIVKCAEHIINEICFAPYSFTITADELYVVMDSGYYDAKYRETIDFISYQESYSESYHDGGGSGSTSWWVYAALDVECKAELTDEIGLKKCPALPRSVHLPYCRGYWEENGHVYLVDPWGLTGVFEYYCEVMERWDYASEEEIWKIGVPYSR